MTVGRLFNAAVYLFLTSSVPHFRWHAPLPRSRYLARRRIESHAVLLRCGSRTVGAREIDEALGTIFPGEARAETASLDKSLNGGFGRA